MARSFTDAIGYVERNENMWSEMIRSCWQEWIDDHSIKDSFLALEHFESYALSKYGIKCWWNQNTRSWEFQVIDSAKYTFFQVKYATS